MALGDRSWSALWSKAFDEQQNTATVAQIDIDRGDPRRTTQGKLMMKISTSLGLEQRPSRVHQHVARIRQPYTQLCLMHRLAVALAGLVVTATLAIPASAMAGDDQRDNPIGFSVNKNGLWTTDNNLRIVTQTGNISLTVKKNNLAGGMCVQLRTWTGILFTDNPRTCWGPGRSGRQQLAGKVLATTHFYVWVRKMGRPSKQGNDWNGSIYY